MVQIAISQAVRPVLFYTGIDEFRYATHGGTAFVVSYKDRPYAVTCRHVFKDFDEGQLTLFGAQFPKKGDKSAKIRGAYYPSSPRASAVDSDVTDFCLIEFETNVTTDFFGGNAYPLNDQTICSSAAGDRLLIFGALKEKTVIDPHITVAIAVSKLPTPVHHPTLFYGEEPRSTWATNFRLSQELAARRSSISPTIACAG